MSVKYVSILLSKYTNLEPPRGGASSGTYGAGALSEDSVPLLGFADLATEGLLLFSQLGELQSQTITVRSHA